MVLDDLVSTCTMGVCAIFNSNIELNYLRLLLLIVITSLKVKPLPGFDAEDR